MFKRFSAQNVKNFRNKVEVDFSDTRDYEFNTHLIKNGLINKMLIYGSNNSGKSNLGSVIMDITTHLSDTPIENPFYPYFLNGDSSSDEASFSYEFQFGEQLIRYKYTKNAQRKLLNEKLLLNDELAFTYDYETGTFFNEIPEVQSINLRQRNTDLSALKFIFNNTLSWPENNPIANLFKFVQNMVWVHEKEDISKNKGIDHFIIHNGLLAKLETFLGKFGQSYALDTLSVGDTTVIGTAFKNSVAKFDSVASSGALSLRTLFYRLHRAQHISFLYVDDFASFYHPTLAKDVLRYINEQRDFQSLLTTHTTLLLDNELMRPDCYMIIDKGGIRSLANSTDKTIRITHNLENMMLGGEFA